SGENLEQESQSNPSLIPPEQSEVQEAVQDTNAECQQTADAAKIEIDETIENTEILKNLIDQKFNLSDSVKVKRSSGEIEDDWKFLSYGSYEFNGTKTEGVRVVKQGADGKLIEKGMPLDEFCELNNVSLEDIDIDIEANKQKELSPQEILITSLQLEKKEIPEFQKILLEIPETEKERHQKLIELINETLKRKKMLITIEDQEKFSKSLEDKYYKIFGRPEPYASPEQYWLNVPGGVTFWDEEKISPKILLNPLLGTFKPDYQLFCLTEELMHFSQLKEKCQNIKDKEALSITYEDEIEAKKKILNMGKFFGFSEERIKFIKDEIEKLKKILKETEKVADEETLAEEPTSEEQNKPAKADGPAEEVEGGEAGAEEEPAKKVKEEVKDDKKETEEKIKKIEEQIQKEQGGKRFIQANALKAEKDYLERQLSIQEDQERIEKMKGAIGKKTGKADKTADRLVERQIKDLERSKQIKESQQKIYEIKKEIAQISSKIRSEKIDAAEGEEQITKLRDERKNLEAKIESSKTRSEKIGEFLTNKEIQKQILKAAAETIASVVGIKSFYDVPAYFKQKFMVRGIFGKGKGISGSMEELLGSAWESKKVIKEKNEEYASQGEVKKAIDDLNKRLKKTKEGSEKGSEQRRMLAQILRENRLQKKTEKAEREKAIKTILDNYTTTKITGMQAVKESLNTFFVASGAYVLRGVSYGLMDGVGRYQDLRKQAKREGGKVKVLQDVIVKGIGDTFKEAVFINDKAKEATKLQKGLTSVRAWGKIAKYAAIGTTMSWHPQTVSGDISKVLDAFSGKTTLGDVANNFKYPIERYGEVAKLLGKPLGLFGEEIKPPNISHKRVLDELTEKIKKGETPSTAKVAEELAKTKTTPESTAKVAEEVISPTKKVFGPPAPEVKIGYHGGKSIWQEAEKQLSARFHEKFEKLGGTDLKTAEVLKNINIDRLKDTIVEHPQDYGLPKGVVFEKMSDEQIKNINWDKAVDKTFGVFEKRPDLTVSLAKEQIEAHPRLAPSQENISETTIKQIPSEKIPEVVEKAEPETTLAWEKIKKPPSETEIGEHATEEEWGSIKPFKEFPEKPEKFEKIPEQFVDISKEINGPQPHPEEITLDRPKEPVSPETAKAWEEMRKETWKMQRESLLRKEETPLEMPQETTEDIETVTLEKVAPRVIPETITESLPASEEKFFENIARQIEYDLKNYRIELPEEIKQSHGLAEIIKSAKEQIETLQANIKAGALNPAELTPEKVRANLSLIQQIENKISLQEAAKQLKLVNEKLTEFIKECNVPANEINNWEKLQEIAKNNPKGWGQLQEMLQYKILLSDKKAIQDCLKEDLLNLRKFKNFFSSQLPEVGPPGEGLVSHSKGE
ncbi:hypothetical protein COT20_02615, partial [bacterium (Candidatus Gribaldobacteria) CG08_land_8_20_14_0_20_39_15]